MQTARRALGLVLALICTGAFAAPATATEVNIGFSQLTYICPTPNEIDFAWPPADNVAFYSLQLVVPTDTALNGGLGGAYLPQFGTIEITKGQIQNASLLLGATPVAPSLSFQLMLGGQHGYTGLVPLRQAVTIPIPCTQHT